MGATTLALLQACGPSESFSGLPAGSSSSGSSTSFTNITTPPANQSPSTGDAIRHLQPALAVRGVSCLACHANIQANVITDFGYGNNWFLDSDKSDFLKPSSMADQGWYTPYTDLTFSQVGGQLFVPASTAPANFVAATISGGSSAMDLMAYLTDPNVTDFETKWFSYFPPTSTAPAKANITENVMPPALNGAPQTPLVEEGSIYIGAPTSSEILATKATPASEITGFTTATGSTGSYTVNSGTVQCAGQDVLVAGTLLLNNLSINAGNGGCRLYVTGTVFIEGPITYTSSSDATTNLQITSSTSIIMGVGLTGQAYVSGTYGKLDSKDTGSNPLDTRLLGDTRQIEFRSAPSAATYATWANAVYAEGTNIGASLLVDASVTTGLGASQIGTSPAGQAREIINFDHLLLNAPVVHSRYLGSFNGIIIAEIAEMALGDFAFTYDSVFSNSSVPLLPALYYDILCTSSANTTCTPAQL